MLLYDCSIGLSKRLLIILRLEIEELCHALIILPEAYHLIEFSLNHLNLSLRVHMSVSVQILARVFKLVGCFGLEAARSSFSDTLLENRAT